MANASTIERLLSEFDAFDTGERSVLDVQRALLAHGSALEATPENWQEQIKRWDAALDAARFTQSKRERRKTAERIIREFCEALSSWHTSD